MNNPFYRIPSIHGNKKLTPKKYFTEIKAHFDTQFNKRLNIINEFIGDIENFQQNSLLSNETKQDYSQKLNREYLKNPTKLGVFKAKNDLAIQLNKDYLFSSEKGKEIHQKINLLVANGYGIDSLQKIKQKYENAFSQINKKYSDGEIKKSFENHLDILDKNIPENLYVMIGNDDKKQFYKTQKLGLPYLGIENSYQDILKATPLPKIQNSSEIYSDNIPDITIDPIFNEAFEIQERINVEMIINNEHRKYEAKKETRGREINENGKEKKLRFKETVDYRTISDEVEIDIYSDTYHPAKTEELAKDIAAEGKAQIYKYYSSRLDDYAEIIHNFKNEAKNAILQRNREPKNSAKKMIPTGKSNIDNRVDGKIKLSGKPVDISLFRKPFNKRSVTIHHSSERNYGDVPKKIIEPSTNKFSIDTQKLIENPSQGNDNDRLILANAHGEGQHINYIEKNNKTGKRYFKEARSIGADYPNGYRIMEEKKQQKTKEKNGSQRKRKQRL